MEYMMEWRLWWWAGGCRKGAQGWLSKRKDCAVPQAEVQAL